MVDSLSGFVRLSNLRWYNPDEASRLPSLQERPRLIEAGFEHSVTELEDASRKIQRILQRKMELEILISAKKNMR
ncbi:hypothetical protein DQ04_00921030 [Trypanosoma grayi]|uniref:hypothetical protein n=1 Tax=Trypanosoma grayi TaxID=71804 RepID=UPI0004F435D9|nr:hypothetical protein DQ04_00921030 [Trypanosoma grayi]KEG13569.1 hypothetical protein DQ04_00921030 [Trypanosoma grayi]